MGRGRAKAKQTRVARELKYNSPATDLAALQRELSGGNAGSPPSRNGHGDGDGSHGDGSHAGGERAEEPDAEETYAEEEEDEAYRR